MLPALFAKRNFQGGGIFAILTLLRLTIQGNFILAFFMHQKRAFQSTHKNMKSARLDIFGLFFFSEYYATIGKRFTK